MRRKFLGLILVLLSFNALNAQSTTLKVGDFAPEISMKDTNGVVQKLSDLRGKVVLVDFWASWCGFCRLTNPGIVDVYDKYKDLGFEVYSVSLDKDAQEWKWAIQDDELKWKYNVSDLKMWNSKAAVDYAIEGTPASFLLDEEGKILAIDLRANELSKWLKSMLEKNTYLYPAFPKGTLLFNTKTDYHIYDKIGNVLMKGKGQSVDVSTLEPGKYKVTFAKHHVTETIEILPKEELEKKITFTQTDTSFVFSEEAYFEIYNRRGKLLKKGKAKTVDLAEVYLSDKGLNRLILNGSIYKL